MNSSSTTRRDTGGHAAAAVDQEGFTLAAHSRAFQRAREYGCG
jgi:hypothetical protein